MQTGNRPQTIVNRLADRESFSRTLRAAHTGKTYREYLRFAAVQIGVTTLAVLLLVVLLRVLSIRFTILNPLPPLVQDVVIAAAPVAAVAMLLFFQPSLVARGRKTRIDLDLPYAITYMQALSGTLTLYNIIRSVYEQSELYREVSREFGMIVRDVEVFGDDVLTAMRNLGRITPSENLKKLLDDLVLMFESGGDVTAFLASRSSHYRESAAREMETGLKTLEIMAEVYVTAFVAAPIAVIIMMVAENMSGQAGLSALMPFFLVGLPLGAGGMIWVISLVMPAEQYEIVRREVREQEYGTGVPGLPQRAGIHEGLFRKAIEQRRRALKIRDVLRHPLRHYVSDFRYALGMTAVTGSICTLLYTGGYIDPFLPAGYRLEIFISILAIALLIPFSIAFEVRKRYVNHIEAEIPAFLRELADLKDIGITLQGAVNLISGSKLGLLSSELRMVDKEVRWGSNVSRALVRMEERIGVVTIKRAISLLVRASEVTHSIREVLVIAIGDMEHYLNLKKERTTVSFAYVMIVYLSFAIFLYTAYQLNVSFVSSFEKLHTTIDISGNTQDMFRIGIILGLFSGVMAGQLSAGSIFSGFKHSMLMLAMTLFVFVVIL
ncbi:MAG: type II secretion system F family protein [Methanoregulaceae archaeon]|nr:type II secretion system F family protein [Methanoregulaceae archaeon]